MTALLSIPRRSQVARAHKERGGLVAAVLPIHYPRALLRAFDILPMEVWGPPAVDASYGSAHLQPYVCSIVRNALSFLQMGGLDVADLVVVPHACDSLQGLGSILIDLVQPRQPVVPLYLPRGRRDSDLGFLADEFRSLYRRLEDIAHRSPSDADLMGCIRREEAADELLTQLHQRRRNIPLRGIGLYRLIRAREYLPAETFSELARAALTLSFPPVAPLPLPTLRLRSGQALGEEGGMGGIERAAYPPSSPHRKGAMEGRAVRGDIPILLSGIVPEPMSLFESIDEMGGLVAADDLACCGRRLYPPGKSEDAFFHLAESILGAPPDPTRGSPIQDRLDHLVRLAGTSGARGVVFYDVKFCEPELYDLPNLRKGLQDAGIPSVAIEVDLNDPLSHQALTRLEAFLEMIA